MQFHSLGPMTAKERSYATSTAIHMASSLMTTGLEQVCLSTTVTNATVFQVEVFAVREEHPTLYSRKQKTNNVVMNCDSQTSSCDYGS